MSTIVAKDKYDHTIPTVEDVDNSNCIQDVRRREKSSHYNVGPYMTCNIPNTCIMLIPHNHNYMHNAALQKTVGLNLATVSVCFTTGSEITFQKTAVICS